MIDWLLHGGRYLVIALTLAADLVAASGHAIDREGIGEKFAGALSRAVAHGVER